MFEAVVFNCSIVLTEDVIFCTSDGLSPHVFFSSTECANKIKIATDESGEREREDQGLTVSACPPLNASRGESIKMFLSAKSSHEKLQFKKTTLIAGNEINWRMLQPVTLC